MSKDIKITRISNDANIRDMTIRQLSNTIADDLYQGKMNGFKLQKNTDIIRCLLDKHSNGISEYSLNATKNKSSHELQELYRKQLNSRNDINVKGNSYSFESAGSIAIQDYTAQLIGLIQENYGQNKFAETTLDEQFPDSAVLAETIYVDIYAAPGGFVNAHTYGASVKEQAQLANRTFSYKGQPYRNLIKFNEYDILYDRELGRQPFDTRGITQRLTYNILKARTQLYNTKESIKASIYDGSITISPDAGPVYVIDYQIPSWNLVGPTGVPWGTYDTSTGDITIDNAANPINDIYYYLNAYEPWYGRRDQMNHGRLIMSPITEQFITRNQNVRDALVANQVGKSSPFAPQGQYTVDNIVKSLIPGFQGEVLIDGSSYLSEDSSSSWVVTSSGGSFGTMAPPQNYFIPPGKIFFSVTPPDMPLGQYIMQPSLQQGGVNNPQGGEWIISQALVGDGYPEGLTNPYLQIVYGTQAGLAPIHVDSIQIGTFVTVV